MAREVTPAEPIGRPTEQATPVASCATPAREYRHRDAQTYESLAIKLRKIGNYLLHSFRAQADIGQLNSQVSSLSLAAEVLERCAQSERIEARLSDGPAAQASTDRDPLAELAFPPSNDPRVVERRSVATADAKRISGAILGEGPCFTLVFAGDITKFPGNPFRTDTPFGRPTASGIGNAFDELEALSSAAHDAAGVVAPDATSDPQSSSPTPDTPTLSGGPK